MDLVSFFFSVRRNVDLVSFFFLLEGTWTWFLFFPVRGNMDLVFRLEGKNNHAHCNLC